MDRYFELGILLLSTDAGADYPIISVPQPPSFYRVYSPIYSYEDIQKYDVQERGYAPQPQTNEKPAPHSVLVSVI